MSGEISPAGLRASHADRDRVVEVLRVAAGDGRLTAAELDERVGAALAARTQGELAGLTVDLPAVSAMAGGAGIAEAKDVVRIEQAHSGAIRREGRWVVPRRMELATQWCAVTLDFTQAVITHGVLHLDLHTMGKTLTLITRPGIVVDTDGLSLAHVKVRIRQAPDAAAAPTVLRVELTGQKAHGRIVVRPARRTFGQWLLRKSAHGG
ncbi:DUF1707 domain-containing protein [Streptomyces sp. A7024]|uniref:DUF1707 domain-containing protein n=1 Tax=Streptomyces coryli TaxID=1128680 RepID=A0A6G4UD89_9ACTN|nr:DUF1707 domain-containing protein [Streptomyces coryli]NGN70195.1 DUF1707 domain-containing protein [Streptomyces coryli]